MHAPLLAFQRPSAHRLQKQWAHSRAQQVKQTRLLFQSEALGAGVDEQANPRDLAHGSLNAGRIR